MEFNYRLFLKVNKAVYINLHLNHYRYNENSTARSFDDRFAAYNEMIIREIRRVTDLLPEKPELRLMQNDVTNSILMGIAVNYSFHPDNPRTFIKKLNDFRKLCRDSSYEDGLRHIRYTKFPLRLRVPLFFTSRRFILGVYLVAKSRHLQIRFYNRAGRKSLAGGSI